MPKKGYKQTKEHRDKISASSKGKKISEVHRQKIREARKLQVPPMKGKHQTDESIEKIRFGNMGKKRTEITKINISKSMENRGLSEGFKKRIEESKNGLWSGEKHPMYGKNHTEEAKQKMREARIGVYVGEKSGNWQNGISFEIYPKEFNKELKQSILERDNYTCQYPDCTEIHDRFHVHHIDFNKKNNNPENLIILGNSCHARTIGKNRQYWIEFYQNIMI